MFIEMDGSLTQASGNTAFQNAARYPRAAVLLIYLFVALCKIFIYFGIAAGGNRVSGKAVESLALASA